MVFFVCDGCNETLKKNKVDAHAAKCRDCYAVSCVDCSVSFPGDDYRSHTSCISEAERYEKTLFRGVRKSDHNNGRPHKALTKQEKWTQTVQRAADSAPHSLKSYMDQLTTLENIPAKEKQFRNFAANSLGLKKGAERIATQIWESLVRQRSLDQSQGHPHPTEQPLPSLHVVASGSATASETKRDDTNHDAEPTTLVSDNDETPSHTHLPSDSTVKKILKKALKKASHHKLPFKALRRTVKDALYRKADDKTKSELERVGKKQWKAIFQRIVRENSDALKWEGKSLQLVDGDSLKR